MLDVVRLAENLNIALLSAATNNTEQSEAYAQLTEMAEKLRARFPGMTPEKAFEKVFTDPRNAHIANKAHQRPAPTTYYPMPR